MSVHYIEITCSFHDIDQGCHTPSIEGLVSEGLWFFLSINT
jgi:hypothetical protein